MSSNNKCNSCGAKMRGDQCIACAQQNLCPPSQEQLLTPCTSCHYLGCVLGFCKVCSLDTGHVFDCTCTECLSMHHKMAKHAHALVGLDEKRLIADRKVFLLYKLAYPKAIASLCEKIKSGAELRDPTWTDRVKEFVERFISYGEPARPIVAKFLGITASSDDDWPNCDDSENDGKKCPTCNERCNQLGMERGCRCKLMQWIREVKRCPHRVIPEQLAVCPDCKPCPDCTGRFAEIQSCTRCGHSMTQLSEMTTDTIRCSDCNSMAPFTLCTACNFCKECFDTLEKIYECTQCTSCNSHEKNPKRARTEELGGCDACVREIEEFAVSRRQVFNYLFEMGIKNYEPKDVKQ